MKKFKNWFKSSGMKHRWLAEKLEISTSTLHLLIHSKKIPNLKLAYKIEKHTEGDITLYDWVDELEKSEGESKN